MSRALPAAALPAVAMLALAACASLPEMDAGATYYARLGEIVAVGPLYVTPLALVEDSRCPQGVQCVWAGRVRIDAQVGTARRTLTSGEAVRVGGGSLTLAEVAPPKQAGTPIDPAAYRFGFRFAR